jgi:hypothetical protein
MPKTLAAGIIVASILAAGAVLPAPVAADDAHPAQSAPDLSGIWARANESWFFAVPGDTEGKPLERLPAKNPEEVAGDYNNPILQPWAREIVKANADREFQDEYVPTAHGTCWPSGVPEVLNLREAVELLQTKDKVTIIYQRDHQIRQIFLNQKHSAHPAPSWYGESVGHYEGDTLVVDTIGQAVKPLSFVDPYGTPHTDKLHVIERYRPVKDAKGKGLEVVFRVEDPGTFTMPWKGMVLYRPNRGQFEEVVCAENNRSFGEGTLLGQIPEQKKPEF